LISGIVRDGSVIFITTYSQENPLVAADEDKEYSGKEKPLNKWEDP
jgi:hypothetical protein